MDAVFAFFWWRRDRQWRLQKRTCHDNVSATRCANDHSAVRGWGLGEAHHPARASFEAHGTRSINIGGGDQDSHL